MKSEAVPFPFLRVPVQLTNGTVRKRMNARSEALSKILLSCPEGLKAIAQGKKNLTVCSEETGI